jgi:hypothetical protein
MTHPFRPPLLTFLLLAAAAVLFPAGTAAADDPSWDCPFPAIAEVYAYQQTPEAQMLTGSVDPIVGCPSSGIVSKLDGTEHVAFDYGSFELPLNARSGEWYLSSFSVGDTTQTFQPVAPYLVKVLNQTRITSTAPAPYVGYGDEVRVSGFLEGWTAAAGWQRMPGRSLSIKTGNGIDGHPNVPTTTDESGAYSLSVRIYNSFAGTALFAGDDTWLRSGSHYYSQVHGLVNVNVSDRTPAVGQRIRLSGTVAPGAVPVWLERLDGTEWVKVTATVTADANGHYQLTYRPVSRGLQQYRVWNDGTEPESRMGVQPYFKEFKLTVHRSQGA